MVERAPPSFDFNSGGLASVDGRPSGFLPPGPGAPISPRARHTAFEVADYDAMKATLEREGITYIENTQPGGRIQMLCNDPDGNTLEFQPATV